MKTKNRFVYVAAAAALGFTLASCSDGGEESPTVDESGTTVEQTDDTAGDGSGDDGTETEGAEEGGEDAAAAGPECLIGSWQLTPEAMEEQVRAQVGDEAEVSVEGTSGISFDGETSTTSVDSSSTYSISAEGATVEGASETQGTMVIGYTADDATITYTDVVSAEGAVSLTIGGATQELELADTAAAMSGQTVGYTCTDSELTLTTTIAGLDIQLEQTFTRA